jgi:polyisoprenyl-teichoic acid--peptidoglycan teichoic acid transferase
MRPRRFNITPSLFSLCILSLVMTGCGAATPQSPSSAPFILVTAAADASPTATPFQPSLSTPTVFQPIIPLPSETASPTASPPVDATATVDLNQLFPTSAAPPSAEDPNVQPTALPPLTDNETVNFLLIGSDKRPGSSYRTDTLVIAILWPREGQVSLISIPRDLWIYIPSVGMQRINTAYQSGEIYDYPGGGPGLLRETITYNLGIRIDHTAMVEFDGFRRIVDTLGGVDLPVSCSYTDWRLIDPSYDPYNENNWWLYTVGPGLIHMDGDLALWYARSRSKSNDFDRGRRQQEVLRAILAQALRTDTLNKIPQLYSDLSSTVITDLGLDDILRLALYAPRLTNADIRGYYIRPPHVSSWMTPGGASVLLPNEASLQQMLAEATTFSPRAVEHEAITVEIQNGTQVDSLDALSASRLNYAGYQTHISAADSHNYSSSILVDLTTAQDGNQRFALLNSLGLSGTASQISLPDPNSPVQYRLIVGYDYEPCFKPEALSH